MNLPTIIVIGYRRAQGLARLLASLNNAIYPQDKVHLMISLDGGADEHVIELARRFRFNHGTSEVITRDRNIGVREHILWCGDQTGTFGSTILLEDDLIVDPQFYRYAVAALEAYGQSERVSGIALYAPAYNHYAKLPFIPLFSGYSCYFLKVVCSWGQLWTRRQWKAFRRWYDGNDTPEAVNRCEKLPDHVKKWPESSWDKYFCAYLAIHDMYFAYPYISYTTNFCDPGGYHIRKSTNRLQVQLADPSRSPDRFRFESVAASKSRFDGFMEPEQLARVSGIASKDLEVDFYGLKSLALLKKKKYCLTSRRAEKILKSFPLRLRPFELNLSLPAESNSMSAIYLCHSVHVCKESILQQHIRRFKLAEYMVQLPFFSKWFLIGYVFCLIHRVCRRWQCQTSSFLAKMNLKFSK